MPGDSRKVTGRVVPLTSREASQPPCPPTIEERLALVFQLSREAWQLSGKPYPSYTRDTMPVRLSRLSEQGND